ncbi:hypothetical protein ATB93_09565 [Sphingomonas sp. WG]|nr:hypothetical protein ATB93_09565 [Sphingomonas sp. WG]
MCGGTLSGDIAARLADARRLVRAAWPGAVERSLKRSEGQTFLYAASATGAAVLRLVVDPPNLILHFAEGVRLSDPLCLLQGEGRRGRYICLGSPRIRDDGDVSALIHAAVAGMEPGG